MPGPEQKINTVLIPESGLDLAPEFIEQSVVSPDFSRVFAHVVGKGSGSGVLIKSTSDGSLHVVSAGVPFEIYLVYSGSCLDAFAALNTEELAYAFNVTDFLIELFPSVISFRNHAGTWLPEKVLPVGYHSIDFIHYGFRLRNRNAGDNSDYEVTVYR